MSRWEPKARERLEQAALELFVEVGFAEATVPQITARAGLTTRTFFRHFADKREVLFAAEGELPALVARLMSEAPPDLPPLALIERGLQTVAVTRFEGHLDYLELAGPSSKPTRASVSASYGKPPFWLKPSAGLWRTAAPTS